ncbi:MAG: DNA repair protein RadC [Alphaproteobacteria bacterium]|nr:DNA repair protein RadC [Alphaproteobacteria bacterium]MDD9919458.1 DNA repair protein RadC [Alphaproteobacteria bacterium]
MESKKTPHYHGHRERLKQRFKTAGAENLADYELLELILTYAIPRKDVKPIAKALLSKFHTLSATLGAPERELVQIEGIGPSVVTYFQLLEATVIRYRKEHVRERPAFTNRLEILDYLHAKLGNLTREEFHVLFLDAKNQVIEDACLATGTINASAVYPREVIKAALERGATGLFIAHNHPSGQPTPSAADIELTGTLIAATEPIGLKIYDHIIIGDGRHYSFFDNDQL